MGVLNVLLLGLFIVVAILLILIVLVQNEEGDSLGGIFAGGSGSAFGSRSGNVLTRTTTVLGGLFMVLCLSLALINRSVSGAGVEAAGRQSAAEQTGDWWREGGEAAEETGPDLTGGSGDTVTGDSGDGIINFAPEESPEAAGGQ